MKLHLGCGKRFIPGFIHVDALDFDHIDHVCAVDRLSFVEDGSVDLIYVCHVLEHFKRREVPGVLAEWFRVLKKGGVLRVSVPDFAQISKIYEKYQDLSKVIGPLFGGQNYFYNVHYNTFDFNSISSDMKGVGFASVSRYDWRTTEHAAIDDFSQAYIPHMDKENGMMVSLNVEATK